MNIWEIILNALPEALGGMIVAAIIGGVAYFYNNWQGNLGRFHTNKGQHIETYNDKMSRLTGILLKSSAEMDKVLSEINTVSIDRTESLAKLENQLTELSIQEKQVKERIAALEQVPLEAIAHLEKMLEKGDRRSASRDYLLFFLGVVVSAILTMVFRLLGF